MTTDAPWPTPEQAEARVLGIQTKLHHWATDDPGRRFDDLVNLVCDPKPGGRKRRLGIPTVTDRVVQAAPKLVREPILEADFQPCSYGFRPGRRAPDAIAEIHHLTSRPAGYVWVVEGDITTCFDTIDHPALLARVRRRIADKRVLALIKAFGKGGILTQDGARQATITGTPKGAASPRCWPTSPSAS